jgi:hypothetical protein
VLSIHNAAFSAQACMAAGDSLAGIATSNLWDGCANKSSAYLNFSLLLAGEMLYDLHKSREDFINGNGTNTGST